MTHQSISPTRWEYRLCADSATTLDDFLDADQQTAISQWSPCSQFPTEIHLELMRARIIPHPYKAANEHRVQWVGKQSWEFRAQIDVEPDVLERRMAELEFEGLDTFVVVSLNGKEILVGDNHFLPYKVCCVFAIRGVESHSCLKQVTLTPGDLKAHNELLLRFSAAENVAKAREKEHGKVCTDDMRLLEADKLIPKLPQVRAGSCNLGDPSRVYVRKMQACWRWDWGLELMTMGPDRPITLHLADVKFEEVHTKAIVEENLDRRLEVDISVKADTSTTLSCHCALLDGETGAVVKEETVSLNGAKSITVDWAMDSDRVQLWWPNGSGEQKRYRFECTLKNGVSQATRIPDRVSFYIDRN